MLVHEMMMKLLMNVKMYHWQTKSYAEHKATDQLYNSLQINTDKYIEVKTRDESRPTGGFSIYVHDMNKAEFMKSLKDAINFFYANSETNRTDLINIRDDIISSINQTLYLFTFE